MLLLGIALITGAPWPRSRRYIGHIAVVGLLLQGAYLGGVYAAIDLGIPAGVSALIVGMQPVLTAVAVGPLLGERVSGRANGSASSSASSASCSCSGRS